MRENKSHIGQTNGRPRRTRKSHQFRQFEHFLLRSEFLRRIAQQLKNDLVSDTQWLIQSLQRSEFFPFEDTIFGERSRHYLEEKSVIAKIFSHALVNHIETITSQNPTKKVCLLIDAGTTLYPFFQYLGEMAARERIQPQPKTWIDNIEIITNNFPGLLQLMKLSRFKVDRSDGSLPIPCTLVAGQLLLDYVAITGDNSQKSLQQIITDRGDNCHFIALVTGNWVRLRRNGSPSPVPLARGRGHLAFKEAIMRCSKEIYVISPLGKIFLESSLEDINKMLNLGGGVSPGKKRSYIQVDTTKELDRIRLVTSIRQNQQSILKNHSLSVAKYFGVRSQPNSHKPDLGVNSALSPIFILFDLEETDVDRQIAIEFPHTVTHRSDIHRKFGFEKLTSYAKAQREVAWQRLAIAAAHQLLNPFFRLDADINALLDLIKSDDNTLRDIAGQMRRDIQLSRRIIREFKFYGKSEKLELAPIDLIPLLHRSTENARLININVSIDGSQKILLANEARILICFEELTQNAINALMEIPGASISISVRDAHPELLPRPLMKEKNYVQITFEDNGCGVPLDKKGRIFEPFVESTPHDSGSGLPVVSSIIEAHGGAIQEVGRAGEGAVFEIFLPCWLPSGSGSSDASV